MPCQQAPRLSWDTPEEPDVAVWEGLRTMVLYRPSWAVFVNPNHTLSQGNGPQNDIFFYIFAEGFKNKHTESILLVMLTIILQILTSTGPLARCDKSSVSQEVARNASPGTRRRFGWPALNSLGFHVFQSVVTIMWFFHVFPIIFVIPGSSKRIKFLPFHQKNSPKVRIFTYLEDPGILELPPSE